MGRIYAHSRKAQQLNGRPMTDEEAKELGWCTKPGCECPATIHVTPDGKPAWTPKEEE